MELSQETLDNYQKNLWCLREVTEKLLSHMKGHDYSFRTEITDKGGKFDNEKLHAFVDNLLSGWVDHVRDGLYPDRPGGEDPAESYLSARRELYSLYFYLTMRASLCEGSYALTSGMEEEKERTDFAFLLEQARRFSRSWCVTIGPDGTKRNEPYEGFDAYFGFHLYHVLTDPERKTSDSTLTPYGKAPVQNLFTLTNAGFMKRIYCKHLTPPPSMDKVPEVGITGNPEEEYNCDDDYADLGGDYEPDEVGRDLSESFEGVFPADDLSELSAEYERVDRLTHLAMRFECWEEYLTACKRFAVLYQQAPAEVLRGFSEELEEIVNLYLLQHGLAVLTDTDKTLDVYRRAFDGPCRLAKRYARGILWKI